MYGKRIGVFLLLAAAGWGGPPITAQPPAKAPALPPINPALARLDQTFTGLDGPGLAITHSEELCTVAAACEDGTVQFWHKDTLFGARSGSGSANVLRGHDGPVTGLAWNGGPVLAS